MDISFAGHHIEITSALKAFAEEKLAKLEHHFDKITAIHVVFSVEKIRQIATATVLLSKFELHASAESDNLYTAIDSMVEKLDKQLIKHKEKLLPNHRQ
jgi:putative sigma-54 modulation protein